MTNADLIAAMDLLLDGFPNDRATRAALADLYEDLRETRLASLQRWLIASNACPEKATDVVHTTGVSVPVWAWHNRGYNGSGSVVTSLFGMLPAHKDFRVDSFRRTYPTRVEAEAAVYAALASLRKVDRDGSIKEAL